MVIRQQQGAITGRQGVSQLVAKKHRQRVRQRVIQLGTMTCISTQINIKILFMYRPAGPISCFSC